MQYDDYSFDRSVYQRPNCRYICGRTRLGKKACWQGPKSDGHCGGNSECAPNRCGDRYLCTRPERAGGPCHPGPDHTGQCAHQHPPCAPRVSLRVWRGRIARLAAIAMLGIIAAFADSGILGWTDKEFDGVTIMPGPISNQHKTFAAQNACYSCHGAHGKGALDWFLSAFRPQELSSGCLNCHRLEGDAFAPHQMSGEAGAGEAVKCETCHTEHQGANAELTTTNDQTCANCHKSSFSSFEDGHTPFAASYPHATPQTLYFDHSKHLNRYFSEEEWLSKPNRDRQFGEQAAHDCTACHAVEGATRDVKPKSYELMCAGCHDKQIMDRQLVAMTAEELSPVLLGLGDAQANEDMAERDEEEVATQLLQSMAEEGLQPLAELGGGDPMQLWKGLNALEVQKAAIGWLQTEDFEVLMEAQQNAPGWHVGETTDGDQAIFYQPSGHADPVLRYWIEYYLMKKAAQGENEEASVAEALASLLDPKEGPGGCGKCHAKGISAGLQQGAASFAPAWGYRRSQQRDHIRYTHAPHIDLMGDKAGCDACHTLRSSADLRAYFEADLDAAVAWSGAFKSINKNTCQRCHSEAKIRADCLTCHQYHKKQSYKLGFI